jgi:3-deoxy-manno-octulosonate cytidylyltransferase (CMP-KDO synthetase)
LPDKLLLHETGKPLLEHTIERAIAATQLAAEFGNSVRVCLACDDPELAQVGTRCGINTVLVTEECDSGTERIARALLSLPDSDVVLNLQADEPGMPPEWIVRCIEECQKNSDWDVVTIAVPLTGEAEALEDPNAVKVVVDHQSRAMYFSRAPIPAVRRGGVAPTPRALLHKGLYAYRTTFLQRYFELPPSDLEKSECLEQLRFLQAGARIKVIVRDEPAGHVRGIDTEDDYRRFVQSYHAAR